MLLFYFSTCNMMCKSYTWDCLTERKTPMPEVKDETRIIMGIELVPEAKDRLDEFCERTGMTKVAAASRLIEWFGRQSDEIQAMIEGLIPADIEQGVAKLVLQRIVSQCRRSDDQDGN
jgi:hypothetical protein